MRKRLYILTFLAVAGVVIIIGYAGLEVSLKFMEKKYIQIQIDVNKRQAELISKFLEEEIKSGSSEQKIINKLQNSIKGTETDKGYLCVFDKSDAELICHPNLKMVGMKIPSSMKFDDFSKKSIRSTKEIIQSGVVQNGFFYTDHTVEITYMTPVEGTDWMLSVHENVSRIKEEIALQKKYYTYGFAVLGFIIAVLATFMARIIGRRYEKTIEEHNQTLSVKNKELFELSASLRLQKEEISAQRDEIERHRDSLAQSHEQIKNQHSQITASISYASRIQNALLPSEYLLKEAFDEHFIFYRPKDIVSGDFYWLRKIQSKIIFVAADCTGHGVPGAFMSMLGISYLNEIVSEDNKGFDQINAGHILNELRTKVITSLKQDMESDGTKDGIDLSLIIFDTQTKVLEYSGAYNSIYIIRNNNLVEVEADKMPVGIHSRNNEGFSNNKIELISGDILYLFSDGYADQFGGEKNRKFLVKNFRTLLHQNSEYSLDTQKEKLEREFDKWKLDRDQVDDVLVAGIKIK